MREWLPSRSCPLLAKPAHCCVRRRRFFARPRICIVLQVGSTVEDHLHWLVKDISAPAESLGDRSLGGTELDLEPGRPGSGSPVVVVDYAR